LLTLKVEVARDALKDILIHLQQQVISNLKLHWHQDTFIDFATLQDVSDSSQDRCALVLMQLQQRIITSGPIENLTPPPLNPANAHNRTSSLTTSLPYAVQTKHQTPNLHDPLTPPTSPYPPQPSTQRESPQGPTVPTVQTSPEASENQYRPMATTVTKVGFFGFKRTKVEAVVKAPENPLVDEYLATAIEDEYKGASRANSISTSRSSIRSSLLEFDHHGMDSWQDKDASKSSNSSVKAWSKGRASFDSIRRVPTAPSHNIEILTSHRPINSINPKDLLPSETNKYQGFCKGAWKLTIGDKKRAIEERTRPGGMYNAAKYWQCKHCKFEGRLVPINKTTNGYDTRVFKLAEGIQFRWEYLFKSHLTAKEACQDPTRGKFGCIFCVAEGRPAGVFDGVQVFMGHLIEHRDRLPTGEVLYRMNCLVGRQAAVDEDFDINIVSKEGGAF